MNDTISASILLDRLLAALDFKRDVQLAEFLGVTAQAVSQARKKDKVPDGWLVRAALQGGLSVDALLHGTPAAHGNAAPLPAATPLPDEDPFEEEFCTLPLVAARLSAGGGSLETESQVVQRMAFRRDWVRRKGNPEHMVLMRVYGDSMEPYIQQGDLVLVDQSKKTVIPHTVYAVGVDDGIYVKALETLPGQKLVLRSFNERYAPMEVDMRGDLADSIRIIGKVLWWCHEA